MNGYFLQLNLLWYFLTVNYFFKFFDELHKRDNVGIFITHTFIADIKVIVILLFQ